MHCTVLLRIHDVTNSCSTWFRVWLQIPVLAVLLSPFIPAPIPCIIPFVSPFYSPKLALAPWALGMRAQMASCDAAPSPQDRVVPAGMYRTGCKY